jgi:hypothetical protein
LDDIRDASLPLDTETYKRMLELCIRRREAVAGPTGGLDKCSTLDVHAHAFADSVSGLAKDRGEIPKRVVYDRICTLPGEGVAAPVIDSFFMQLKRVVAGKVAAHVASLQKLEDLTLCLAIRAVGVEERQVSETEVQVEDRWHFGLVVAKIGQATASVNVSTQGWAELELVDVGSSGRPGFPMGVNLRLARHAFVPPSTTTGNRKYATGVTLGRHKMYVTEDYLAGVLKYTRVPERFTIFEVSFEWSAVDAEALLVTGLPWREDIAGTAADPVVHVHALLALEDGVEDGGEGSDDSCDWGSLLEPPCKRPRPITDGPAAVDDDLFDFAPLELDDERDDTNSCDGSHFPDVIPPHSDTDEDDKDEVSLPGEAVDETSSQGSVDVDATYPEPPAPPSSSTGASSSTDPPPLPPPPPPPVPDRRARAMPFGTNGQSVSPIYSNKDGNQILKGWGATCKQHLNAFDHSKAVCKKSITLGRCSSDEARLRMKLWLIHGGARVDATSATARGDHLRLDANTFDLLDEAIVDAMATAI